MTSVLEGMAAIEAAGASAHQHGPFVTVDLHNSAAPAVRVHIAGLDASRYPAQGADTDRVYVRHYDVGYAAAMTLKASPDDDWDDVVAEMVAFLEGRS